MNVNEYDHRLTTAPRYGRNAGGRSRKVPSLYVIRWHGRWRRVYVDFRNDAGIAYVVVNNAPVYL